MLPPRRILFSWTATEYCVTPNVPQKLLIVYDGYFCSTDSFGAMSLLSKVTQHTQSIKIQIAQWERTSAQPGQQGATESYSHPFCAWSESASVGRCNIHAWLAPALSRTLLPPCCQISPQVAAPSKRNPAPVTCQAPSSQLQKHCSNQAASRPSPAVQAQTLPGLSWGQWQMLIFVTTAPLCRPQVRKGVKVT